jgi:DNA-binding PadR family transcriptional regulator
MAKVKNPSLYRALHKLRKGNLHRALGVAEGEKIPAAKLAAARNSTNPHVKRMAEFAHTMSTWKH